MDFTIAKLAQAGGVGVETVRYYQRRGLFPIPKSLGGIRRYGAPEVRRLKFIRAAQAAGFTLEEIRELLALDAGHDHARARALVRERIGALDARIAELEQARDALKRLARDCARSRGPCPIITAFEQDG
jgi:MerR family mercuric resistance operon transcriptional regulator